MANKTIDHIGQEVEVGDWCAITQHNTIYVGKVIKAGDSVTIATNSINEFIKTNKSFKALKSWQDRKKMIESKFGTGTSYHDFGPSWARDGKFLKIKPTAKMEMEYDVKKTKP